MRAVHGVPRVRMLGIEERFRTPQAKLRLVRLKEGPQFLLVPPMAADEHVALHFPGVDRCIILAHEPLPRAGRVCGYHMALPVFGPALFGALHVHVVAVFAERRAVVVSIDEKALDRRSVRQPVSREHALPCLQRRLELFNRAEVRDVAWNYHAIHVRIPEVFKRLHEKLEVRLLGVVDVDVRDDAEFERWRSRRRRDPSAGCRERRRRRKPEERSARCFVE